MRDDGDYGYRLTHQVTESTKKGPGIRRGPSLVGSELKGHYASTWKLVEAYFDHPRFEYDTSEPVQSAADPTGQAPELRPKFQLESSEASK